MNLTASLDRYDAFLSYARSDDERFVRDLYERLTAKGFRVWWDRENMPNRGETFLREIQIAIDKSDRLIAVIGPAAVNSAYVRDEWDYAQLVCKVVVPILRLGGSLDAIPAKFRRDDYTLIPPDLRSFHCPDFRADRFQAEALNELVRILRQPVIEPGVSYYVPSMPPSFLPRRDVLEQLGRELLADAFRPVTIEEASKQTVVLQSMAGTGKSVMAAAFARSINIRRTFSDGVVWLRIGQAPDLIDQWRLLGIALGDGAERYVTVEEAETRLGDLLKEKRSLIVLDDAWDVRHVEPIWNALGARCRLLITTRDASIATSLNARLCVLRELTKEESLALLSQWVGIPVENLPATADELRHECGNLPLALALCGALLRDKTPWTDLLAALKEADLAFVAHDLVNYEHPHVLRALQASVDFLARSKPDAPEHYFELAVFSGAPFLPEAAVLTMWCADGSLSERNARRLLADLDGKALLRLEGEVPDRKVWLHSLQWDYLRFKARQLGPLDSRLLGAYQAKCPGGWPSGPNDGYFFDRLLYHLRQVGRTAEARRLLFDLRWLEARMLATNVAGLLSDYSVVSHEDRILGMVQETVRLSAHVLARDPSQLASQLIGRLLEEEDPEVQALLGDAERLSPKPWFCPLTRSLTPPGGALMRTLGGHDRKIDSVAITPDGRRIVSSAGDGLKVWNGETGDEILSLPTRARCVVVTGDGRRAISASADRMSAWDLETGQEEFVVEGRSGTIMCLAASRDGRIVISASEDRTGTGRVMGIAGAWNAEPEGHTLRVWDFETRSERWALAGHPWKTAAAAVTANGRQAASMSEDYARSTIKVWDLETGKDTWTFEGPAGYDAALAISPDGRFLVASNTRRAEVWSLETRQPVRTLDTDASYSCPVAISGGEPRIVAASGDRDLKVWDLKTGEVELVLRGHSGRVTAAAVTPDGRRAVSGSNDGTLKIWDLARRQEAGLLHGHAATVTSAAITRDGWSAATASSDGILKVWDLKTGSQLSITTRSTFAALGRDGRIAITVESSEGASLSSGGTIAVWDLASSQRKYSAHYTGHNFGGSALTGEGRYFVWKSSNTAEEPSQFYLEVLNLESGAHGFVSQSWGVDYWTVSAIPGSSRIICGRDRGTLQVWDLAKWRGSQLEPDLTLKGHTDYIRALALTPDGRLALSISWDGVLTLWDLIAGRECLTVPGNTRGVQALGISADGRRAVGVMDDGSAKAWDLQEGRELHSFQPKERESHWIPDVKGASSVELVLSGRLAIFCVPAGVKLWDLEGGSITATFSCTYLTFSAIATETMTVVAGESSGEVHHLQLVLEDKSIARLEHGRIARLSYSYWKARGGQGGSAEENWLRAEKEIRNRRLSS